MMHGDYWVKEKVIEDTSIVFHYSHFSLDMKEEFFQAVIKMHVYAQLTDLVERTSTASEFYGMSPMTEDIITRNGMSYLLNDFYYSMKLRKILNGISAELPYKIVRTHEIYGSANHLYKTFPNIELFYGEESLPPGITIDMLIKSIIPRFEPITSKRLLVPNAIEYGNKINTDYDFYVKSADSIIIIPETIASKITPYEYDYIKLNEEGVYVLEKDNVAIPLIQLGGKSIELARNNLTRAI